MGAYLGLCDVHGLGGPLGEGPTLHERAVEQTLGPGRHLTVLEAAPHTQGKARGKANGTLTARSQHAHSTLKHKARHATRQTVLEAARSQHTHSTSPKDDYKHTKAKCHLCIWCTDSLRATGTRGTNSDVSTGKQDGKQVS